VYHQLVQIALTAVVSGIKGSLKRGQTPASDVTAPGDRWIRALSQGSERS
jgi:hypothetical protein